MGKNCIYTKLLIKYILQGTTFNVFTLLICPDILHHHTWPKYKIFQNYYLNHFLFRYQEWEEFAKVGVNLLERLESFLEPLEPVDSDLSEHRNQSGTGEDEEEEDGSEIFID